MHRRAFRSSSAAALFAALAAAAQAATYYVSTTGSADAAGTLSDPLDIATGADKAAHGSKHEVVVLPGRYLLDGTIAISGGGSVLRGSTGDPDDVVLDAQGKFPAMRLANNVLVHSLTVANGASGTLNDTAKNASGIRLGAENATGATVVSNCVVTGCVNTLGEPGGAVVLFGKGVLVDSAVRGNTGSAPAVATGITSPGTGAGVNVAQSGGQVIRCKITGNVAAFHGAGVCIGTASDLLVKDTLVADNVAGGTGAGLSVRKPGPLTVTLEGCTFSGNKSDDSYGGAVAVYTASAVVARDCVFSGNSAKYGGVARVYGSGASFLAENCAFEDNAGTAQGGGAFYLQYGTALSATDCVFSGNSAPQGGAVWFFENATFTATGCEFSGNTATTSGGGAASFAPGDANKGGTFVAKDCTFSGNSAKNGGAVYVCQTARFLADGCTFDGNSASFTTTETGKAVTAGGGALNCADTAKGGSGWGGCYVTNSTFKANVSASYGGAVSHTVNNVVAWEFVNCKFLDNVGTKWGGAVCLRDSSKNAEAAKLFRQCLFAGNKVRTMNDAGSGTDTVGNAGALYFVSYASAVLDSCTFAGNEAPSAGGAIYHRWGGAMTNCLVAANTLNGKTDSSDWGFAGQNFNNYVWPDSNANLSSKYFKAASGNVVAASDAGDPLFVDASAGDWRLNDGSPCRDKGLDEDWMLSSADLAGLATRAGSRIFGKQADIGAYEIYVPSAFVLVMR